MIHVRSYFMCWGVSFQRISIQKKRDHPFCDKWGGEISKSRIFRDNSEVEFCRKFKCLLWQKITQDFFTSGLVRVLVCFPFHRIHWDLMPVMFMRCFFFCFWFFFLRTSLTLSPAHRLLLFCSCDIFTSCGILHWTEAQQHSIFLFSNTITGWVKVNSWFINLAESS